MKMIGFVFSLDAAQAAALRASKPMIPPLRWERKEPEFKKACFFGESSIRKGTHTF